MGTETSAVAIQRRVDADRILQALLRPLLSKQRLDAGEVESLLTDAAGRILDALEAEALLCYHAESAQTSRLVKVYRSRAVGLVDKLAAGDIEAAERATPADQKDLIEPWFAAHTSKAGIVVRSSLVVPVLYQGQPLGALQAVNKLGTDLFTVAEFDVGDQGLLCEIALYGAPIFRALGTGSEVRISESDAAWLLARVFRLESFEPAEGWRPDAALLALAGESLLRRCEILPVERTSPGGVKLAMARPLDVVARDAFRTRTGLEVEKVAVTAPSVLRAVINRAFPSGASAAVGDDARRASLLSPAHPTDSPGAASAVVAESDDVIRLANRIIEDAYNEGASDIHIEPFEHEVKVRVRVDGLLKEVSTYSIDITRALVSRLKIMTRSMDITENRLPQDGRIKFRDFVPAGPDIDLRVSTAPLVYGQKIVMRILDRSKATLGLDKMGFSAENLRLYRDAIRKPYGMVLHVGPTGSGKTTTLYAALAEINQSDVNIQTAEDPIEYMLSGVNHMQMQKEIGLTFAAALRCFLRQDPDIILVGEIRDLETAEIAVEAALTGHLIFSTLHTNDAPGTVTRFVDMGVEPFLISSSLVAVCAQRLMRKLCPQCRVEHEATAPEQAILGVNEPCKVFQARPGGCAACKQAGYRGRIGVHEVMTISDSIQSTIARAGPGPELRQAAIANGMVPLYNDAMAKVLSGVTSIEEALSVVKKE